MKVLKLIIAALQPIIWWVIYYFFYPMAKVIGSEGGLSFACIASAFLIIMIILIPAINKSFDE